MPRIHEAEVVSVDGRAALVDVELAPLVRACWRLGIGTVASCQEEHPGVAYVGFAGYDDAHVFAEVSACLGKIPGWIHQLGEYPEELLGMVAGGKWVWISEYHVWRPPLIRECGEPAPLWTICLHFPHADIPALTLRLEESTQ